MVEKIAKSISIEDDKLRIYTNCFRLVLGIYKLKKVLN